MTLPPSTAPGILAHLIEKPKKNVHITAQTHSREQILTEKAKVDSALKAAKQQLADAKRRGKADREFMSASEFSNLERRVARLASKSQILQLELTRKRGLLEVQSERIFSAKLIGLITEHLGAEKARVLVVQAAAMAGESVPKLADQA